MNDWPFFRQVNIRFTSGEVLRQPFASLWMTENWDFLLIDIGYTEPLDGENVFHHDPVVLIFPFANIEKITVWILQGKSEPQKSILLENTEAIHSDKLPFDV